MQKTKKKNVKKIANLFSEYITKVLEKILGINVRILIAFESTR